MSFQKIDTKKEIDKRLKHNDELKKEYEKVEKKYKSKKLKEGNK
jgi:hypothetical protein